MCVCLLQAASSAACAVWRRCCGRCAPQPRPSATPSWRTSSPKVRTFTPLFTSEEGTNTSGGEVLLQMFPGPLSDICLWPGGAVRCVRCVRRWRSLTHSWCLRKNPDSETRLHQTLQSCSNGSECQNPPPRRLPHQNHDLAQDWLCWNV